MFNSLTTLFIIQILPCVLQILATSEGAWFGIKHSLHIKSCISLIQMSPQLSSDYNVPPLFLFILKFIFSKLFWQMFL